VKGTIAKTVGQKLGGGRPGPFAAGMTAIAVGGAVAVTVYRALRS
jgi:hypothetical protein